MDSGENAWRSTIVSGLGMLFFWGRLDPIDGAWHMENVTQIMTDPRTMQQGLMKWVPQVSGLVPAELVINSQFAWEIALTEKMHDGLAGLWSTIEIARGK